MEQKPLDRLRCVVERITYQSDGYSVLKCAAKGYTDLVAVVGMMPDAHVGSVLTLGGHWKIDSKYGRQFEVVTFEETLPATVYGIEKYLGSGLIKGIGPKFAKLIVSQFGKDTLEVIETDPDQLLAVPKIGQKRVDAIKRGWAEQKEIKNIMLFLQEHDVSTAHATRIYKAYGADSIAVVKENPYRLADDIWGIGFKTADTIARKLGMEKEKFVRLRSGLMYTLNKLSEEGHCFGTREQLMETGVKLLDVEEHLLSKEVFNGDIGTVQSINMDDRTLVIRFDDRDVDYDVTELDEIVLAYATTVHKAQGAEYPIVVMPVMMTHFAMLQRNLLYTGVTRAKKVLMLVGTKKAIAYCVKHVTVDKRNTLLAWRLNPASTRVTPSAVEMDAQRSSRYVVFDVETPNRYNDRMSAIGISIVEDGTIVEEFLSYVNPEESFDEFNTQLTGISEATVANAPTFAELWSKIEPMMSSGVLVAHNAQFDLGVLRSCLSAYGIQWKRCVEYICTVQIGRRVLPGMRHGLAVLCDHYGIELDHHKADSDSHAAAEILLRYMAGGVEIDRYLKTWVF